MSGEFIVARNLEPASTLPYILYVPIEGGLWLKVKEAWPRATRVYCHPTEPVAVREDQVIERVLVAHCERRGAAIDLVLQRGVNKRSQFVFTTYRGRSMIFWQTPKSAAASRPGLRVPFARARTDEIFCVDSRERYGYNFKVHGVTAVRRALPAGDYGVEHDGRLVAVVERKSIDDFARSLIDGSLNFAIAELAITPWAAVVVEGMYSTLLRHEYTRAGFLPDLIARVQVRYPSVPIVFAESRKIGEEWTFRFLRAAHANAGAMPLSALPGRAVATKRKRSPRKAPDK